MTPVSVAEAATETGVFCCCSRDSVEITNAWAGPKRGLATASPRETDPGTLLGRQDPEETRFIQVRGVAAGGMRHVRHSSPAHEEEYPCPANRPRPRRTPSGPSTATTC